jgi:hypothetical protein
MAMTDLGSATTRALGIRELLCQLGRADLAEAALVSRERQGVAERELYTEPKLWEWDSLADEAEVHLGRVGLLARTVAERDELAGLVRTLRLLVVDSEYPPAQDHRLLEADARLLWACKRLEWIEVES